MDVRLLGDRAFSAGQLAGGGELLGKAGVSQPMLANPSLHKHMRLPCIESDPWSVKECGQTGRFFQVCCWFLLV